MPNVPISFEFFPPKTTEGAEKLRVVRQKLAEGENESLAYAFPSSPSGFTKARVEYNKPLLLDLRALAQHMDKVLLFSHIVVLSERWSISMEVAEQRSDDLSQLLDVNSSITAEIRLDALLGNPAQAPATAGTRTPASPTTPQRAAKPPRAGGSRGGRHGAALVGRRSCPLRRPGCRRRAETLTLYIQD